MVIGGPAAGFWPRASGGILGRQLIVRFNGEMLEATSDVSEPYPNPYPDGLGTAETLRAWNVPAGLLTDSANAIEIEMTQGSPLVLSFVDLAVK